VKQPRVAVAATGVANLASMLAALARAGADAAATKDADELAEAEFAVLPGVGAFGAAAAALRSGGMDLAFEERYRRGSPSLGACLGMQLFFEGSEESPGSAGLGILPGVARRFGSGLPLPQLGWNRVFAQRAAQGEKSAETGLACASGTEVAPPPARPAIREGWAYFANSYRVAEAPPGCAAWLADYGESFLAALEAGGEGVLRPALLLCQFHPELSGRWGLGLLARWLGTAEGSSA
jgi:glutamine amidotransferase